MVTQQILVVVIGNFHATDKLRRLGGQDLSFSAVMQRYKCIVLFFTALKCVALVLLMCLHKTSIPCVTPL